MSPLSRPPTSRRKDASPPVKAGAPARHGTTPRNPSRLRYALPLSVSRPAKPSHTRLPRLSARRPGKAPRAMSISVSYPACCFECIFSLQSKVLFPTARIERITQDMDNLAFRSPVITGPTPCSDGCPERDAARRPGRCPHGRYSTGRRVSRPTWPTGCSRRPGRSLRP